MNDNNHTDSTTTADVIDEGDLVFTRDEQGNIQTGGYSISSAMNTLTKLTSCGCGGSGKDGVQSGGGIVEGVQNLLVPAGLFYLQQAASRKPISNTLSAIQNSVKDLGMLEESVYDKLIDLASFQTRMKHNKKTRRRKKGGSKGSVSGAGTKKRKQTRRNIRK